MVEEDDDSLSWVNGGDAVCLNCVHGKRNTAGVRHCLCFNCKQENVLVSEERQFLMTWSESKL